MTVGIRRHADAGMTHLIAHVDQGRTVLDELASERMTQIVEPDFSKPGSGEAGLKDSAHNVPIKRSPLCILENQLIPQYYVS
jgi:hypothetical protein